VCDGVLVFYSPALAKIPGLSQQQQPELELHLGIEREREREREREWRTHYLGNFILVG
jgi:hypothetical protein